MFKTIDSKSYKIACLVMLILLFLSAIMPYYAEPYCSNIWQDLMVQIKSGRWILENKQFMTADVFSWHEGLEWCPHEIGWYVLSALLYNAGGVYAIYAFGFIMCSIMLVCIVIYNRNHSVVSNIIAFCAFGLTATISLYNIRPHTISVPIMSIFILVLLNDKISDIIKSVIFIASAFIMSWFHGGMIPLIFVIYAVYMLICLVLKQFRSTLTSFVSLVVGFGVSLLNPIGFDIWTYASTQSQTTVWNHIDEWNPGIFSMKFMFFVAVAVIGFCLKSGLKNFNKKALLQTAYLCMFAIMFARYRRFYILFALMFFIASPAAFDAIFEWLASHFKIGALAAYKIRECLEKEKVVSISAYSMLVVGLAAAIVSVMSVFCLVETLPENDINKVAEKAGYPMAVVNEIKDKGYERIFNSYNAGAWLLYNDIKVSQDNRCDPYLKQFSGDDYICMSINTYKAFSEYVDKFKPDALVLEYTDGSNELAAVLDALDSDKYNITFRYDTIPRGVFVSDETLEASLAVSSEKEIAERTVHWIIAEISYD